MAGLAACQFLLADTCRGVDRLRRTQPSATSTHQIYLEKHACALATDSLNCCLYDSNCEAERVPIQQMFRTVRPGPL